MKNALALTGHNASLGMGFYGETRGLTDALDSARALARQGWRRTPANIVAGAAERADHERLRQAFGAFSDAAARLEDSYAVLRSRVEQLSGELGQANGELAQQLQEKQRLIERQTALLAALPAGVVVIDREGIVREANAAAEKLMGPALVGQSWQAAAARLSPAACDFEWLSPGDAPRRIGLEEQTMDAAGERIVLLHDVTEAHAARERQQRTERLAAMGEMTARLAHQLRTPLATAMLYAGQLERSGLSDSDRDRVGQRIMARLRSLERVTRDLLRFARGEHSAEQAIEVGALLAESTQVMEPLLAARGIAFVCADHTGGASLQGDRRGLAAAILSLLENAAQATEQGGKVRVEAMANSKRVCISVSDSGSGIPAQSLPRVFDPFYSTRSDGTGLGLAIVKSVVEAHGGSVEVASSEHAGTCFTLTLPCAAAQRPASARRMHDRAPCAVADIAADRLSREAA